VLDIAGNIPIERVLEEIEKSPFLECIVISGGEPTIHEPEELIELINTIKKINPELKIRIDTNGSNPDVIEKLKPYVDGFAVDIKSPLENPEKWKFTTGVDIDPKVIVRTITLVDGMPLTLFRTVRYPWLSEEDIEKIKNFTSKLKSPWYLNPFYAAEDCPFNERIRE
jgi:pyruvate formate lyase activating enzyme